MEANTSQQSVLCRAAGANVLGQNEAIVWFRRCAWHTILRLYFWTGGFFSLFLIQGKGGPGVLAKHQLTLHSQSHQLHSDQVLGANHGLEQSFALLH